MNLQTWEYRIIDQIDEPSLNSLGADGWELVDQSNAGWVLKRPAPDFREQVTLDQRRRYFGYWGLEVPGESTP
ncbi:MAG: hypothetical protein AB7G88_11835 [Thermomicrobiales bacterium]